MRKNNRDQDRAIKAPIGPVQVIAGAGSGKTRVLTERIRYLYDELGEKRILAVTFTNKAAGEMKERLSLPVAIGTFHSICLRILREFSQAIGFRENFIIFDEDDSKTLVKQILKSIGRNDINPSGVLREIDRAKNNYTTPQGGDLFRDLVVEVYSEYQKKLRDLNALDFGDLLVYTVKLFETKPLILERLQNRFKHILVDEFQDTNLVQYKLLKLLSTGSIFVVGDEDQSIYAFRGAQIENILSFEKDFPNTQVFRLEQNYRSTKYILEAANAVIKNNLNRRPKALWTDQNDGKKLKLIRAFNEKEEARKICDEISRSETSLNEIAIFYRTNAQSRALEEALIQSGISYRIFGGLKFFERKEVKDLISYLKFFNNPCDFVAFQRIINSPPRGIGVATAQKIIEEAKGGSILEVKNKKLAPFVEIFNGLQGLPLKKLAEEILKRTGYVKRLFDSSDPQASSREENINELLNLMGDFGSLIEFLDHVALMTSSDTSSRTESSEYVSLMTLHISKGLEFKKVFLTGLEEGLCPHSLSFEEDGGIEEERRLLYVGITRAKEELTLSCVESRGGRFREMSRFISEIPEECFETDSNSEEFYPEVGTRVRHKAFGDGEIIEILQKPVLTLKIQFDDFDEPMNLIDWRAKIEEIC